jgi:hypothetical protein
MSECKRVNAGIRYESIFSRSGTGTTKTGRTEPQLNERFRKLGFPPKPYKTHPLMISRYHDIPIFLCDKSVNPQFSNSGR